MRHQKLVIVCLVAAIGCLAALRIWLVWPEELPAGPQIEKMERRGREYSLYLKQDASLSDILAMYVFEGYTPEKHAEFQEAIDGRPSRYVKEDRNHSYTEYVGKYGRIQFHYSYDDVSGIVDWFELFPTDLSVDVFFRKDIAINFELSSDGFLIYIIKEQEHMYMTVTVRNRKIHRIVWLWR